METIYVIIRFDVWTDGDCYDTVGYVDNLEDALKILHNLRNEEIEKRGKGNEKWDYDILRANKIKNI